jgi:hypothetical protein
MNLKIVSNLIHTPTTIVTIMIMLLLKCHRIKYKMIKSIFLIEGLTINLLTVDVAG